MNMNDQFGLPRCRQFFNFKCQDDKSLLTRIGNQKYNQQVCKMRKRNRPNARSLPAQLLQAGILISRAARHISSTPVTDWLTTVVRSPPHLTSAVLLSSNANQVESLGCWCCRALILSDSPVCNSWSVEVWQIQILISSNVTRAHFQGNYQLLTYTKLSDLRRILSIQVENVHYVLCFVYYIGLDDFQYSYYVSHVDLVDI